MAEPIGWRVLIDVDASRAELVADELFTLGALGIEEIDAGQERLTLVAGMPDERSVTSVVARLGGRLEPIYDDGWADAWREWARPHRVGSVLLQPAWLDIDVGDAGGTAQHVILLDPGRSFGSGSHETTRLALDVLLEVAPDGGRVLDVGCGSGVLGIALAVARAATVVAVDIDPHAVEATRANAARNGVADSIDASTASLAELTGAFDVVAANILAVTLRELAPEIARLVAPDGVVVLSGMLSEQVASVDAAYAAVGLRRLGSRVDGEWAAAWYTPD